MSCFAVSVVESLVQLKMQHSASLNTRQLHPGYGYGRPQDSNYGSGNSVCLSQQSYVPENRNQSTFSYPMTGARYAHPAAYGSYVPPAYSGVNRYMSASGSGPSSSHSPGQSLALDQLSKTNLYIRGLQPNTTDRDLVNLCQGFGKIMSTKAIIDPATNTCKGYGFVDFELAPAAEAAVQSLQSKGIQAQMAKQQERDVTNLYIANLPVHVTENDLETMFGSFGKVISTRILRDQNTISRGVGFARMESKEHCEAVIQAFNGKLLPRFSEPLTVKFADSGNKKKFNSPPRPWVDRNAEAHQVSPGPYNQASQNGLAAVPSVLTSQGIMGRGYRVQAATLNNYVATGNWLHPVQGSYIVPHPMAAAATAMIPGIPGLPTVDILSGQIGQLRLAGSSVQEDLSQSGL